MSQRDQGNAEDPHAHHVLPLVDATGGDWDAMGEGHAQRFGAYTETDEAGRPLFDRADGGHRAIGAFDPRCLTFHDMKRQLPSGGRDRRWAFRVVNDPEAGTADPEAGGSPYQRDEWHHAQRSTREVRGDGASALPFSQRVVVDSEDGKHALALVLGDLTLRTVSDAPAPGPVDDVGGGLPPKVSFAPDDSSVTIDGLTFRTPAAVSAARAAAAAGGATDDVARAASHAWRGLPPPPRNMWEGAGPEPGTGTRPRAPAPDTNPAGSVVRSGRARGYTTDGRKHGLLSTVLAPPSSIAHVYFLGSEGTPIGPQGIRHDAHHTMAGLTGRIAFDATDASTIERGSGRAFKGTMRADTSRANQNTDVGGETCQWVPVVEVDAQIPPSTRPPPPSTLPRVPTGVPTPPPPGAGGGGGGGGAGGGAGGGGAGGAGGAGGGGGGAAGGGIGVVPGAGIGVVADRRGASLGEGSGTRPPAGARVSAPTRAGGEPTDLNAMPPVAGPSDQGRDFTGPGVPCPHLPAGRVITTAGTNPTGSSSIAPPPELAQVPLVQRAPSGALVDEVGFPAVTALPGQKRVAIGGRDPKAEAQKQAPQIAGPQLLPPGSPTGEAIDNTGIAGGSFPLGFGAPGGRAGQLGFTPGEGGDRGVAPGAAERREAAVRRARAEAERVQKINDAKAQLRSEREQAEAAAKIAKEAGNTRGARAAQAVADRARRGEQAIAAREREATARRQRLENYKRDQAEAAAGRAARRQERAAQEAARHRAAVDRARAARQAREGQREAPAPRGPGRYSGPPSGAWVISTEDPKDGQRFIEEQAQRQADMDARIDLIREEAAGAREFLERQEALLGKTSPDTLGFSDRLPTLLAEFGEYTTANAPVPLLGSAEAPTLEVAMHRVALAAEAQRQILMGLCGGPSYFAGNLGQRETNRPGREVTGSSLGQNAVAYPGTTTTVGPTQPALEVVAQLSALGAGAVASAVGGSGLAVRRVHTTAGGGAIGTDVRPLVLLDNDASGTGKVTADALSTPDRGAHINCSNQMVANTVFGAPKETGADAVVGTAREASTGAPKPNAPAAVLTEDGKVVTRLADGSQWEDTHEADNTTTRRKRMPDGTLLGGYRVTPDGSLFSLEVVDGELVERPIGGNSTSLGSSGPQFVVDSQDEIEITPGGGYGAIGGAPLPNAAWGVWGVGEVLGDVLLGTDDTVLTAYRPSVGGTDGAFSVQDGAYSSFYRAAWGLDEGSFGMRWGQGPTLPKDFAGWSPDGGVSVQFSNESTEGPVRVTLSLYNPADGTTLISKTEDFEAQAVDAGERQTMTIGRADLGDAFGAGDQLRAVIMFEDSTGANTQGVQTRVFSIEARP